VAAEVFRGHGRQGMWAGGDGRRPPSGWAGGGVGSGTGGSTAAAEMRVGGHGWVSLCGSSQRIRFLIYYNLDWTVVN
jgi:hypothetical protein